jgi:subtilisin family serine protease
MSAKEKISPAFEPFMAESRRNDKRDAIVIYRTPVPKAPPVAGRSREPQKRLSYLKEVAALQRSVEERLLRGYKKASSESLRNGDELQVSAIGSSALPITTVEVTRATLRALAEQPEVVAIMPNQQIQLIQPKQMHFEELSKRETSKGMTWGLEELDIPKMWETTQGEHINVAVLDTGVYGDHPALEWRVKEFVVIDPLGRRIWAEQTFDSKNHGTHVCGIIAGGKTPDGISIGVAPRANLLVAGVLVGDATLRTLMEGISWAVERGADVVNMSLGFSYYEPLFAEVFDILIYQFGILPVVAIGNNSHGNTDSPGNAYSAFSVGAVEKLPYPSRKIEVSFFSSGASLVFPDQRPNDLVVKPDVVAPGAQVFSCIPPEKRPHGTYEYTYMDGTSMAAPHVSGSAALLMAAMPEAPITDIIDVLKETARHPTGDQYRPDNRWGYGLVQPVEALKALA